MVQQFGKPNELLRQCECRRGAQLLHAVECEYVTASAGRLTDCRCTYSTVALSSFMSCMSSAQRKRGDYRCRCGIKKFAKRWRKASFGIVDAGGSSSNINDVCGMAGSLTRRKNPGILQLSWSNDMNGLHTVSRKVGRQGGTGPRCFSGCKSPLERKDMHAGPVDERMSKANHC